jgi:hypothetical protein
MSEPPSDIGEFLKKLYPVVCDATDKYKKIRKKGAQFEDEVSEHIYDVARDLGYSPYKPRYTLELPTRSNNKHQFDAAFTSKDTYYLVECKNTQTAGMDYIYYFNSKILDYAHMNPMHKFKGIFLCAAAIPDSAWRYSISYGLRLLDPDSPPIEYMISTCSDDLSLGKVLESYLAKLEDASEYLWEEDITLASSLYEEYRYYITRWRRQLVD